MFGGADVLLSGFAPNLTGMDRAAMERPPNDRASTDPASVNTPLTDRPKILVTHRLFEEPRAKLGEYFDAECWSDSDRPQRSEVLRRVADKDGLICLLTEKIDDELLAAAPRLRIVANVAVGFDNIDVAACTRRKVAVTNTPGVLDETTADFAWTLLMAVARRLIEGDAQARSGAWKGWNLDQLCGADVWGKTLGLVGFGRIGRAVARRASGFGMRVIYSDRDSRAARDRRPSSEPSTRSATTFCGRPTSSACTFR